MPLLVIPFVYFFLSLLIGGVAGFAYWDFSLLKDLIIVWSKPVTDSGPVWRTILLLISIAFGVVFIADEFEWGSSFMEQPLPPRINPDDYNISPSGQCVGEREEPTTEEPKERIDIKA